jgi:hypothetical protein
MGRAGWLALGRGEAGVWVGLWVWLAAGAAAAGEGALRDALPAGAALPALGRATASVTTTLQPPRHSGPSSWITMVEGPGGICGTKEGGLQYQ